MEWERSDFEDLRTLPRGVVGEVACVGIRNGDGDGETKRDGTEFHIC